MFQSFAFQSIAFQCVVGVATLAPNGNSTHDPYQSSSYVQQKFQQETAQYSEKLQEVQTDVRAIEYKLEDLELRRLRALADETMQLELLALLQEQAKLQQLLVQLQEQELMMRREEDDILALLMCLPFNA